MATRILVGNNMIKMRELEDESIDCIVTSPPYFGLRDYGTGKWEGGDPNCDHIESKNLKRDVSGGVGSKDLGTRGKQPSTSSSVMEYKIKCNKCNAIKIDYVWGGDENCEHEWSKAPPRRKRHPNDHTKGTLNQIASAPHLKETDSCHKCGGWMGGYGLEPTPEQYIKNTLLIFDELHRVLKPQGTVWWNIGDSYAMKSSAWGGSRGHNSILKGTGLADKQRRTGVCPDKLKSKDLMMIPARVAIAVAEHGWYLRSEIIWHKPNPMPESVKDRPTSAHEKIYLFAKNRKYYYDADAVKEKARTKPVVRNKSAEGYQADYPKGERFSEGERTYGDGYANKRNVWTVTTKPFKGAHFTVFPTDLIEPCIKAGCPKGGTVLDPFGGSGTTGLVANNLGRDAILIELNEEYVEIAKKRLNLGLFSEVKDG